jgi:hypothetical protein
MDDLLTHAQKEFAQNPVEVIGAALSILAITLSTLFKAGRGFWAMLWARVRSAPGEKTPTGLEVASPVMTQNFNPTFNPIINIHPAVTATPIPTMPSTDPREAVQSTGLFRDRNAGSVCRLRSPAVDGHTTKRIFPDRMADPADW